MATVGDHNDAGSPIALDGASLTGGAFRHLAREVIDAVDQRNQDLPPTIRVDVSKK